ncbi:MAG: carboxylating nicotinate-nucleotide diphosphorylase [Methanocorpusculum sp.]|nr:carboxylating nicotinate-nucleotide diphosphorylase [Methanocorpusculum sp.]
MNKEIEDKLLSFYKEDAGNGDITTEALIDDKIVSARIEAREDLVLAGVEECVWLFNYFGVKAESKISDGCTAHKFDKIISLNGSVRAILSLERTCLNLLGRMSGIATETSRCVELVKVINSHVKVSATRKTAPGLKFFDKKAVVLGGGLSHRYDLSDAFLIKDTHRTFMSVSDAVKKCRAFSDKKVECEVESVADAVSAAKAGADIVMFDNMSVDKIREAIEALVKEGLREKVSLELSGGIRPDDFQKYAGLDIDTVSMGYLTHSVRCADVSLEIDV